MNSFLSTNYAKLLVSLTLIAAIFALGSYGYMNLDKSPYDYDATISVTGEGEVLAVPDVGQFSFSVTAVADTAVAAQEASGTAINDILAYLREQGIEDKDIKTQNYNLYPRYRWEERVCPFGSYCGPGEQVQDGFEVSQTVTVKVRETDKAGAIIAGVGEMGATNISSLNFTIDDMEALRAEAREQAIADAKAKAERLADQLGVDLKRIVSFYEEQGYYQPYYSERSYMAMDAAEGFGGAELPMGEESTKVSVNITYEIK